ncbi:MAG: ATP-binding protein, partial [Bacteroidota bacterium]
ILENGKVAKSKSSQIFNMSPIHVTLPRVGEEFDITIQVSNYDLHKSGILHNVYLGNAGYTKVKAQRSIFYSLLLAGGTFFLGLFFMLTIFTKYFNNRLFYFGLFIASFGYWNSSTSKVYNYFFPDLDWIVSLRLEFFCLFLFNFALMGFVNAIYPKQNWKPFIYFTQGLEIVLMIFTIVLPMRIIFPIVSYHLNWIGAELIYILFVVIRTIKTKTKNVVFIVWGLVGGILNFIIYLLQENNVIAAQEAIFFITNIILLLSLGLLIVDRLFFDLTNLSRQAKAAVKVKSQFLSVVSHEMRTPMNAVIGMTDLLAKTPLSKLQSEYIDSIQMSGNSLITIIDDILDITRIQEGKIRIEQKVFDLRVLLKQAHQTFQEMTNEKGLTLKLHTASNLPKYIKSDPARIRQILDNLVGNAVKFTAHGFIQIAVTAEKVNANQFKLDFEVKDTGIGIASENLKTIFDPFSQEDSSLSRRHMGIGLGLPISRQLSNIMGGDISVESEEGKGTTFTFHILAEQSKDAPLTFEYLPEGSQKTTLRILVAEDNLLNRKLILTGLENIGYQADSVVNGLEVLKACEKKDYDLIFMDIQMPEMDGLEATRLLRNKEKEFKQPYIIALTANAFPEDRSAALVAGMDKYLIKPIKLDLIKQILYQLEYGKEQVKV